MQEKAHVHHHNHNPLCSLSLSLFPSLPPLPPSPSLSLPLFRYLCAQALLLDSTNVEAIACIASQHFYTDQPEIALQFYKRLAQMGYRSAELWNNMGLCSFYSSQYHTALQFFSKALDAASDTNMADVWCVRACLLAVAAAAASASATAAATKATVRHL